MNKDYSLDNLPEIATELIKVAAHKTLLFYGEMGAGKTTLIKQICKVLSVEDNISSPTFSLVNEYQTSSGEKVFHFDFYRITDEEEALDMGIEDYLYNNTWCLIEWPQNVENLLPLDAVEIHLSILENGQRNIQLK
ncbi:MULTISPECIES: tRNA (adenosine(37)-N6)-threonylcarbamoyltransferase complex ATPase subunit type 1 TsaE [unclassified Polaribacter]|uniref:tRNA (adenosine(37)-N6)-threonylcarbamoyltransferase complex ATPase subunit type 1 TsaE n=1 Tax=unclassified Polaribacter TaxID=196858 RepID=UPI00090C907D|nr:MULTISPECIES: tRNA (adenosine(37)-N6)-threonylcarbamoyltransferase complex ATPase subunit type 1 TsaE [unclassified Polaribacter]AQS93211.1 tRNA (adenosine(37)-N6)-threonylcarbamoyltransferase complex ATPase subunit type 1 TsaE [Polaribacter sp. BM10]SHN08941.1 tRNA threonylcarbamoyladenosine biosynthesis protein TsaE [Polaribacter sp. KT 15]